MSPPPAVATSSITPLRKRKRANTKTLLGDEYQEVVTEVLKPPVPPPNASGYDEKHFKEGLKYADFTLRNKQFRLSPIGTRALQMYKDACARLLDLEEGEVCREGDKVVQSIKEEWMSIIRTHEQSMQFIACLHSTATQDAQTLQDRLLNLQRTALYSRYGDCLASACRELQRGAEVSKVRAWQKLQGRDWAEIDSKLQLEKPAYEKVLQGEGLHERCPTHIAVSEACDRLGFDMRDMLSIIHHNAARNELLHPNLILLIKKGHYSDLKKRLHDDYCDVPLVVSATEGLQSDLMLKLLESTIELWFNRDPKEPDNYQMWEASAELKKRHKQLQGPNPRSEADIWTEIVRDISKRIQARLLKAQKEKGLIHALQNNFPLAPEGKRVKRVASSQLQAEKERVKKMKSDWAKIEDMAHGLRKMSDTYYLMYGELGAPPNVVADPFLDY